LDFLGFSRVKRALSIGYTGFSLENFSSRFLPKVGVAETRNHRSWKAKGQDHSWGKSISISDFLQEIS
jgi:hypothetical protein